MVTDFAMPRPVDTRSSWRFLLWLVVSQRRRTAGAGALGTLWMVGLAAPPYLLSRAIDDGFRPGDRTALLGWVAALCGMGVVNALVGIERHRTMTMIRMDASFRVVRCVVWQATRLGATLPRRSSAGEVAAIGMSDVQTIAQSLTVTGPGVGAVIAYVVVAALLLAISPLLAVVVLTGVPVLAVTVGPLLHRSAGAGMGYRQQQRAVSDRLVDVASGLRVLNGLGGKRAQAERFGRDSAALRESGYRVGAVTSWVGALGTGLPALFLAVVTWLGARMAAQGSITIGDLVAVYGYAAMLAVPVSSFIEGASDLTAATVSARRVIDFLHLESEQEFQSSEVLDGPAEPAKLYDPDSGVEIRPGLFTALAASRPEDGAAILDRLARLAPTRATWDGTSLEQLSLDEVRERILLADNEADIFAGSVAEVVAGRFEPDEKALYAVIHAAVADDIVAGLPEGLESAVTAHGGNFSGGQRQRLRLARALFAAPEVLLASEPTSAVDAHTEALMAARLREARLGRTTVLTTTSPLVLEAADIVVHVVEGKVAAIGTHHELLNSAATYRALVSRSVAEVQP